MKAIQKEYQISNPLLININKQNDGTDKWYYNSLKSVRTNDGFNRPIQSLSRLFRGVTSNNHGDLFVLFGLFTFISSR